MTKLQGFIVVIVAFDWGDRLTLIVKLVHDALFDMFHILKEFVELLRGAIIVVDIKVVREQQRMVDKMWRVCRRIEENLLDIDIGSTLD